MCAITIQVMSFLTVASLAALLLTNSACLPLSALAVARSKVGGGLSAPLLISTITKGLSGNSKYK